MLHDESSLAETRADEVCSSGKVLMSSGFDPNGPALCMK